jgi:hypothetical protein
VYSTIVFDVCDARLTPQTRNRVRRERGREAVQCSGIDMSRRKIVPAGKTASFKDHVDALTVLNNEAWRGRIIFSE